MQHLLKLQYTVKLSTHLDVRENHFLPGIFAMIVAEFGKALLK
jgi:hypothetical protein